jgi:hypothetical protein
MADRVRLQIKKIVEPEEWEDVGVGVELPTSNINELINFQYDSVYAAYPDTVTEVYTYKLSGDTVATITIIYTDDSKETLISCIRT